MTNVQAAGGVIEPQMVQIGHGHSLRKHPRMFHLFELGHSAVKHLFNFGGAAATFGEQGPFKQLRATASHSRE